MSGSIVGLKTDKGYKTIYIHYNTYGVQDMLLHFYKNEARINSLLDLGDLRSMGRNPESKPGLWKEERPSLKDLLTYCVPYKEMGEENRDAKYFNSKEEILKAYPNIYFFYIWENGRLYHRGTDQWVKYW